VPGPRAKGEHKTAPVTPNVTVIKQMAVLARNQAGSSPERNENQGKINVTNKPARATASNKKNSGVG